MWVQCEDCKKNSPEGFSLFTEIATSTATLLWRVAASVMYRYTHERRSSLVWSNAAVRVLEAISIH